LISEFYSRGTRNVLDGCTFRNIYRSVDNGGIIYLGGTYDITMIDCNLDKVRTEKGDGSAIYSEGLLFFFVGVILFRWN
jgi:hypothetical protein